MRAAAQSLRSRIIASLVHHRNSIIAFRRFPGPPSESRMKSAFITNAHSAHFPIILYSFHTPSSPDNIASIFREPSVYSRSWRGRRCAGEGNKWQSEGAFIVSPGWMEAGWMTHGSFTEGDVRASE